MLGAHILLLIGSLKKNRDFFLPYLVVSVFIFALWLTCFTGGVFFGAYLLFVSFTGTREFVTFATISSILVVSLVSGILIKHFGVVVFSLFKKLGEEELNKETSLQPPIPLDEVPNRQVPLASGLSRPTH